MNILKNILSQRDFSLQSDKQTCIFISFLLGYIEHCTGIQRRWKRVAGSCLIIHRIITRTVISNEYGQVNPELSTILCNIVKT